ncbi:MAG: threonine aldolase family protein [Thermoplasmatota archaeon]
MNDPAIDLRSDTVTRPTAAMRNAMAEAVVGNASWGEDPTVRRLEEESARWVGKEGALFVPSGTMGNQVAVAVHALGKAAPEVICEAEAHLYINEAAGLATIAHAQVRPIRGDRGTMDPAAVEAAIEPPGNLKPETALICVENTHNYAGGAIVPIENLRAIHAIASRRGIPVHLDGARVFNAAAALGVEPSAICEHAETVQFCFSKGMGAPVGSVLCGSRALIAKAAKIRQAVGGAMRQAGVLAAPALVGLAEWKPVMLADHRRAKRLAEGLSKCGFAIDPRTVETNILIVEVPPNLGAHRLQALFLEHDIGASVVDPRRLRFVTHRDVDDVGIDRALDAAAKIAPALRAA